ncbi:MAG: hypothetical protein JSR17_09055 [Proteobacteria bacterium]|nr:hypothetical protein [Pseudomonadota bacterium]
MMSKKGPPSPTKTNLHRQAAHLPPVERIHRERISGGDQSLILSNGESSVLLVTGYTTAKRIELLRQKFPQPSALIEIPRLKAVDVDVVSLISTKSDLSSKNYNAIKKSLSLQKPSLLSQNVIYELPRHQGNVDNLGNVYFTKDSIATLEKTLIDTVTLLHSVGLTHNDICPKNVLFSGKPPVFRLCDWGSITASDPLQEKAKYDADIAKIHRVIEKASTILAKREEKKEKALSNPLYALSYLREVKLKGFSPLKPEPQSRVHSTSHQHLKQNLLVKFDSQKVNDHSDREETKMRPARRKVRLK